MECFPACMRSWVQVLILNRQGSKLKNGSMVSQYYSTEKATFLCRRLLFVCSDALRCLRDTDVPLKRVCLLQMLTGTFEHPGTLLLKSSLLIYCCLMRPSILFMFYSCILHHLVLEVYAFTILLFTWWTDVSP